MLSPRAVRLFKARPKRDYSLWKELSDADLLVRRDVLPIRPPIWKPLQKHQKVCLVLGAHKKRFAFFNETGTGKTFLSIALMAYFKRTGDTKCNLILVPNKINKDEWVLEGFEKHAPHMKCVALKGSTVNKWQTIADNSDADAFVETYMGFVRMCCDLKQVKRKKRTVNRLVPNLSKMKKLMKLFQGVYADESTFLANKKKLPYRLVNKLSKAAEAFFILTATPFGRDVEKMWAQLALVDRGYTLGETLTLFRQAFYDTKVNFWGGYEYKLKDGSKEEISKFIDNVSIAYPANEADMPQLSRIPRYVSLDTTAEAYYERAKEQVIASFGNYQEMKNAFLRMRQISSGFVGYRNDETGLKARFEFEEKPKLELLRSVLGEIDTTKKVIIFHEFQYTAGVIQKLLRELGIGYVAVNGMVKDSGKAKRDFKTSKTKNVLVLSNSAGGYGLNLQFAKYGIYYESPVSAILRKQTEKRFDRQFSLHENVILFDLIVRGTVDQTILDFHREGRNLWKAILNTGPKALRGIERRVSKERILIAA